MTNKLAGGRVRRDRDYQSVARRLAAPSVVVLAAELLLVLLDPRIGNAHLLLATLGTLQFVASSVRDRPVAAFLYSASFVFSGLAAALGAIRYFSSSEEDHAEAIVYGFMGALGLVQQVYGWSLTRRQRDQAGKPARLPYVGRR